MKINASRKIAVEGFNFGKINNVITYANNHFAIDKTLKTNPFLEHLIKERIVINIYMISIIEVNL